MNGYVSSRVQAQIYNKYHLKWKFPDGSVQCTVHCTCLPLAEAKTKKMQICVLERLDNFNVL